MKFHQYLTESQTLELIGSDLHMGLVLRKKAEMIDQNTFTRCGTGIYFPVGNGTVTEDVSITDNFFMNNTDGVSINHSFDALQISCNDFELGGSQTGTDYHGIYWASGVTTNDQGGCPNGTPQGNPPGNEFIGDYYSGPSNVFALKNNGSVFGYTRYDNENFAGNIQYPGVNIPNTPCNKNGVPWVATNAECPGTVNGVLNKQGGGNKDMTTDTIMESKAFTLHMYPNPADEEVRVEVFGGDVSNLSWKLINSSGGQVSKGAMRSAVGLSLDVGHLPDGLYLIVITDNLGQRYSEKLIVR